MRQQDAFFSYGIEHLKPLNLRKVAEAVAMHESTISRVTSNKYMATPRGIFEMKYFFTSAIPAGGRGRRILVRGGPPSHSSDDRAETFETVLSDDMIVDRLKAEGIDIARRTVAKYRGSDAHPFIRAKAAGEAARVGRRNVA